MSEATATKLEIAKAIFAELKKLDPKATCRFDVGGYHPMHDVRCLDEFVDVTIEERWSRGASFRSKPTGKFQVIVARFTNERKLFPPRKAGVPYAQIAESVLIAAKGSRDRDARRRDQERSAREFDATVGGKLRKWIIPKQANRIIEAFTTLSPKAAAEILKMIESFP